MYLDSGVTALCGQCRKHISAAFIQMTLLHILLLLWYRGAYIMGTITQDAGSMTKFDQSRTLVSA